LTVPSGPFGSECQLDKEWGSPDKWGDLRRGLWGEALIGPIVAR